MNKFTIVLISVLTVLMLTGCSDTTQDPPETYAIGDIGPSGVGLVFYVTDGGLHGLEVAPEDQDDGNGDPWSNNTNSFPNGSPLPEGIGTGSANTDAIIAEPGHSASAAQICRDYEGGGMTDWFLPSRDELKAIWNNLVDNGTGANSGVGGFGGFSYWSSSEVITIEAWLLHFSDGSQYYFAKYQSLRIRAVRVF